MNTPARLVLAPLAIAGLAVACSSGGTSGPSAAPSAPATTGAATTTTTGALTAQDVLATLTPAGAADPVTVTAESDTNHLLGRPGQYTAKVTFTLSGGDPTAGPDRVDRGGAIEIWPDAVSAKKRSDYIQSTLAATPMLGTEYDYLAGPVLVRVTGKVTPANAKKISDVVDQLPR